MRAKNKAILPPELARKISPWIVSTAEMTGTVGKSALTGFVAFCLYGPVGQYSDHNGFVYLLGPWIYPNLCALLLTALFARIHFRVYRGSPFAERSFVDGDSAVMRFNELSNSEEA